MVALPVTVDQEQVGLAYLLPPRCTDPGDVHLSIIKSLPPKMSRWIIAAQEFSGATWNVMLDAWIAFSNTSIWNFFSDEHHAIAFYVVVVMSFVQNLGRLARRGV